MVWLAWINVHEKNNQERKQHKQGMVGPRESVCVQDGDKIRQDKQSSVAKKWEAMCQQLWAVARQVGNEVGDDEDNEGFKMDEAVSHTVV